MAKRKAKQFQFNTANEMVEKLLKSRKSVPKAMEQLIADCQKLYPHPDWDKFSDIDFESDLVAVSKWAEKLLKNKPIPKSVNIIWLGIYNPSQRGKASADFYLTGASGFYSNVELDDWDWKKKYWPSGRYAKSIAMKEIYRIAYQKDGIGNPAEYTLCLGYAALVANFLGKEYASELSKTCSVRAMGVGFDSGDYLLVGSVSEKGWKRFDEKKFLKPPEPGADDVNLFEFVEVRKGNWYITHPDGFPINIAKDCKKVRTKKPIVLPLYEKGKKTNLSITVLGGLVVTKKVANLLDKLAPGDFQRIPVKIEGERGSFEIINVLSNPMWKPMLKWAKKNKSKIANMPTDFQIMRVGKYPAKLVIARPLKEALEKFGVTGVTFKPLSEPYDWEYKKE